MTGSESKKYVYIVYPSRHSDFVSELISQLKQRGYNVKGRDCKSDITGGACEESGCLIAVISKDNINSQVLGDELGTAKNMYIPIVPVYAEKVSVPFKMTALAQCRTALNLYAYSDRELFYKKFFSLKSIAKAKPDIETDTDINSEAKGNEHEEILKPEIKTEKTDKKTDIPKTYTKKTDGDNNNNKINQEEAGYIRFPDGMYKGDIKNGVPDGEGEYYYSDSSVYKGGFKSGKYDGKGEWTSKSGNKYKGDFKDNEFDGFGEYIYSDLSSYKGGFKNGKRNGKGVSTSVDGDIYEGEFKDGFRHGFGTYTFADGSFYSGQFAYGERNGTGKFINSDGDEYEGEFSNGEFHGSGVFSRLDGACYCGEFKNGKRDGTGVFVKPDGTRFEGRFSDGEINGYGELSYPNGRRIEGYFENGEFVSESNPNINKEREHKKGLKSLFKKK